MLATKVCWWRQNFQCMLVKTFLYVCENTNIRFHTYSPTYYFSNIVVTIITALCDETNRFSPTSFTKIRTAFSTLRIVQLVQPSRPFLPQKNHPSNNRPISDCISRPLRFVSHGIQANRWILINFWKIKK